MRLKDFLNMCNPIMLIRAYGERTIETHFAGAILIDEKYADCLDMVVTHASIYIKGEKCAYEPVLKIRLEKFSEGDKIIPVSENKYYKEIDGIRLIYENRELTGWYNPNPKVGEWLKNKDYISLAPNENNEFSLLNHYECSLCGWEVSSETDITFNHCPDCGAKMLESEVPTNA